MRRQILILSLFILAPVFASADEWNKTFKVTGTPELQVDAKDGAVELSSWDQKAVQVRVETAGWRIGADQVRVIDRQMGDRVEIEVLLPKWNWGIHLGNHRVRMYVNVPRESRLDIHTGDGNIHGSDLRGELRLRTGDGGIDLEKIDGKLNADTGDGQVRVSGRFDQIEVRTGDGSIRAEVVKGSKVATGWSFNTGDGSIDLRLPEDLTANLDARTGDGNIQIDVPVLVSGSLGRNQLHGKMNGGGPPLEIRTGDGSIRVSRN